MASRLVQYLDVTGNAGQAILVSVKGQVLKAGGSLIGDGQFINVGVRVDMVEEVFGEWAERIREAHEVLRTEAREARPSSYLQAYAAVGEPLDTSTTPQTSSPEVAEVQNAVNLKFRQVDEAIEGLNAQMATVAGGIAALLEAQQAKPAPKKRAAAKK